MSGEVGYGLMPGVARPYREGARGVLMPIGILLTNATQFRIPGFPLGPGELCIALWIALSLGAWMAWRAPPLSAPLRRLIVFWVLFALGLCLGTLTGFAIGEEPDATLALHDTLAYCLMAAFSCLGAAGPQAAWRLQRSAEIFARTGGACLVAQLMAGWGFVDIPAISPWFWDRFRGWSNNPNQLALFCAVLVLVSLHLADTVEGLGARAVALLPAIPALVVGRLTKTDTFTLSLLTVLPVYSALKLRLWLAAPGPRLPLRAAGAWILLAAASVALVSAAPLAVPFASGSSQAVMSLMKGQGREASQEASLRLALWSEAVERGLEAYLLGLGPGPHLPIPLEIEGARRNALRTDLDPHPTMNGTANFEAHSTPLDVFTQGGLVAACGFLWLLAVSFAAAHKARFAGLVALLACVTIFGLTNNIIRVPIFWFAVIMCLTAAGGGRGRRGLIPTAPQSRNLARTARRLHPGSGR